MYAPSSYLPASDLVPIPASGHVAALASVIGDGARLAALHRSGLLDTPPEPAFDRITALARRLVAVPHAQFSLIDRERQFAKSRQMVDEAPGASRECTLAGSFCQYVVSTGATFAVTDARTHPTVRENPAVLQENVVAYLGVPVRSPDGHAVGALCAVDHEPRAWQRGEEQALLQLAGSVETEIALRESEGRYRAVVEGIRDVVFQTDGAWRLTFLNPAWEGTGYTVAEALGREFAEFFHPDDLEGYRTKARAALAGGAAHLREELRFVEKDGRERWAEVHVRLIRGADGRVVGSTGVLTDITDAVRFKAEREARERTEEMLRLKSAFLNNMSHEIRTPLTAIIGFAEVLADEVGAEHREHVAIIDAAARRLHGTLDAVLALAQIESGSVPLDVEALDAYDEAEAALARSRPAAERKGLTLTLTGGPSFVVADRPALRRVLGHLIGNAVKFTERGGVTVEVGGGEGAGWIRVSDTGAGIPAAFLPRLFGEFTQGSEGYGRSHEGSGLGLAVAKRLLGLMGGALDVASEAGRGATFTVRLPAVAPTAAA